MKRFALIALTLFVLSCAKTPVEPEGVCGGCAAPGPGYIPPEDQIAAAIEAGKAEAALTCNIRTYTRPKIVWERCRFWVSNAISTPGGSGHGTCATGMTDPNDGLTVWISQDVPSNEVALIKWEAGRNASWIQNGCGKQAYHERN